MFRFTDIRAVQQDLIKLITSKIILTASDKKRQPKSSYRGHAMRNVCLYTDLRVHIYTVYQLILIQFGGLVTSVPQQTDEMSMGDRIMLVVRRGGNDGIIIY